MEDDHHNPLITEFGYCEYKDSQFLTIQELPEKSPPGLLPRSLGVVLEADLIDSAKPGDRIQIVGVYKSIGNRNQNYSKSNFKTLLIALTITSLDINTGSLDVNEEEVKEMLSLAKKPDLLDYLTPSLIPTIFGLSYLKQAILLQLVGGAEKTLENGSRIRGDINILLIGDPSTAKSQLLRWALTTSHLGIATTGRGSTGVGLTAAVTTDQESGERRLEAGAMVLADRGLVCIDEFDKMSDLDRVAIHETMEQQTVTITKAGIHTTLNARCAMLAAANPVWGMYDETRDPFKNIGLPDSLLSRFDLCFLVLDKLNEDVDRKMAKHILEIHSSQLAQAVPFTSFGNTHKIYLIRHYLEDGAYLHKDDIIQTQSKGKDAIFINKNAKGTIYTQSFIKKYISFCKQRQAPTLSLEAQTKIQDAYVVLRNDTQSINISTSNTTGMNGYTVAKTLPVTPRTLEAIIRLSTANAKLRLKAIVEEVDVEVAINLVRFALFKEVPKPYKPKKIKINSDEEEMDELMEIDKEM